MNSLLFKNWKLILIAVCLVLIVGAWQYDHTAQYRRGRESMAAEISSRLKDSAIGKAKQDRELSAAYQTGKAVREEKERVMGEIEEMVAKDPDTDRYTAMAGGSALSTLYGGSTNPRVTVYLKKDRSMKTKEKVKVWKKALE